MSVENPYEQYLKRPPEQVYFGSVRFLDLIKQQIESQTNTVLGVLGLPGSGKSSLLRHLDWQYNRKPAPNRMVLYVPFGELRPGQHPFPYLYDRFQKAAPQFPAAPWTGREPTGEDQATAIRLLHEGVRILGQQGKKLVFLFDDFHLAFPLLEGPQTTQLQHWRNDTVMVVGTARELAMANPYAAGSVFYQMTYLHMPRLSDDEALRVLTMPLDEQPTKSGPTSDQKFLLRYAGGHVSLLLHGAHVAWQLRQDLNLQSQSESLAEKHGHMWKGHLQRVYLDIFHRYWVALDENEKRALLQLASGSPLTDLDAWACAALQVRGLLDEKTYSLFSELFTEYLKRKKSEPPQTYGSQTAVVAGLVTNTPAEAGSSFPKLTGLEAELYHYLQTHNRTCTYTELIREVWQKDLSQLPGEEEDYRNRLATAISKLRSAIGTGTRIENIRDQGYRLIAVPKP